MLTLRPVSLAEANAFVAEHHRHQVVGTGTRPGADDDGHAEGQDQASCHQQSQPPEKRQSGGFVPPVTASGGIPA